MKIQTDVIIKNPDKNIFQIKQEYGRKKIYLFVNSNRAETITIDALFPAGSKTPWIWNPEDGTRRVFPFDKTENELTIELEPLQSLLLVFDPDQKGNPDAPVKKQQDQVVTTVNGPWQVKFHHADGQTFERVFEALSDFGTSDDASLNTFAGTVNYTTFFNSDGKGTWLEIEKVRKGVTEVYLNGKHAGISWYGKPRFRIDSLLMKGKNRLEMKYTSVLSNYVRSLKDNPTAVRWTEGYEKLPSGLEGSVIITR